MVYSSIDSWTGEYDEDYCYDCQKFVEADTDGNCPICETSIEFTDDFASGDVAKTTISSAPSVSSTGDIWGRSRGYTWGGNTSTWNTWGGSSLSGMWSTGSSFNRDDSASRLLKHKRHLDSLCKVVDPTVHHTLEFAHANTGYTNMNTGRIVVDGTLLERNDDKLDVVAGLSIHEKLHLVHTKPLTKWEKKYQHDNRLDYNQIELLHSIANSVEDEYIEKQLQKDCAGFVKYIVATKDYYFNEKVKDSLNEANPNPYLDLMNTLLALIRYPENINADRKKRHAKHIRFFARALANALDSREDVIKAIKTLYEYMNQVADKMAEKHGEDIKDEAGEKMKELRDKLGDTELSEEDWKEIERKVKADIKGRRSRKTSLEKLLDSRKGREDYKNMCGATDYKPPLEDRTTHLDSSLIEELMELEDTDYHETKLGRSEVVDAKSRKITWRTAKTDDHSKDIYRRDIKMVKPQISKLKRKIQLYGNREKFTIRNQKRGRLDKRMLHRIPMDRRDIFNTVITKEDKPLDVCLLVDESGSMGGIMQYARQSCIAVKEALEENAMLDLWVMGHTADGHDGWHADPKSTNMTVYHSPTITDRPFALGGMRARYENRDGNAILSAAQRVKEETDNPASNKLMIVFSDGSPAAIGYGGTRGIEHTAKAVKGLEAKGWSVIQVGFGGAHYQERMFSNHIYVNDITHLSDKISRIIRKVLKI
jgi:hypothetical protein